jgi:tetratricopeptide (TPR) repeat protein
VNFFGDTVGIILPHSHLLAAVSQLWWQDEDPRDKRTATFPEVAVTGSFADYVEGRDPALDLALTTRAPSSMEDVLQAALPRGEEPTLAAYKQFVDDPTHRFMPDQEARINALGYKLIRDKNLEGAVRIFEVNAHEHPNSANAYDSLGEGYADAGDVQKAIQAYRRSVELNPGNDGAKQMILKLEEKK